MKGGDSMKEAMEDMACDLIGIAIGTGLVYALTVVMKMTWIWTI